MDKKDINLENIIVINLKRAIERKESIENQLNHNDIFPTFYSAIDGNLISNPGMNLSVQSPNYLSGNLINNNEVACLFSHIGAITHAKISGYEYVIILEDDIIICDDFKSRLNDLFKRLPEKWEHVFLSAKTYGQGEPFAMPSLLPTKTRVSGAYAYMVHRRGYDKLINRLSKFDTVTDDIIERFILKENGLKSYIYYPFFAYPKTDTSYIRKVLPEHLKTHESYKHFKQKLS